MLVAVLVVPEVEMVTGTASVSAVVAFAVG